MQKAIDFLSKNPIFQEIIEKYGLPAIPKRPQGFETLVLLILEQQVSIDSAKATFLKIKAYTSCNPETLFILPDEEFRALGVSCQKTKYIKILSEAVLNKDLDIESLASKPATQVREELIKLKGIGNWTIDIYLMFCLQEPDVIPLGDIAVINTIKELLDIHDKKRWKFMSGNGVRTGLMPLIYCGIITSINEIARLPIKYLLCKEKY